MELKSTFVQCSPDDKGYVRLGGEVTYDNRTIEPELYWFDVPSQYANDLSTSGNPWLAALLPLAMSSGETLRLCRPVDRTFYENVQQFMRIRECWYPNMHAVRIQTDLTDGKERQEPPRTAAFFSGGVDSLFTTLWHQEPHDTFRRILIDDLLLIWGFDLPLQNSAAFCRARARLEKVAAELGKNLIHIATNIRTTSWGRIPWLQGFACAMSAAGLVFENRYAQLLIPSGMDYRNLGPHGSHPLTDPLLSTSQTRIIHDGAAFDRVQKTRFLAQSEIALRTLRVCWRSHSDENCGACEKCYRTMLTLELLGVLDRCPTFQGKRPELAKIPKMFSENPNGMHFFRDIQDLAWRVGRNDVARALGKGIKRNKRLGVWLPRVRRLSSARFFWRLAEPLERAMLAGLLR